jgi:DNA polymerase elongation subunit (family B)
MPEVTRKRVVYPITYASHAPLLRPEAPHVDPFEEDVAFQIIDVTRSVNPVKIPLDDGKFRNETTFRLHGITEGGNTVLVDYSGYRPYFYLHIPKQNADKTLERIRSMLKQNNKLPMWEMAGMELVWRLPSVGFTNNNRFAYIKFSFYTMKAYSAFNKAICAAFPPPTKSDIDQGIYNNEYVVCEHRLVEEMKFMDQLNLVSGGWAKLKASTYQHSPDSFASQYAFCTSVLFPLDKKTVGKVLVDSLDIEQIRGDRSGAFPDFNNPEDHVASIGHVLRIVGSTAPPVLVVWTWLPEESKAYRIENGLSKPEDFPATARKVYMGAEDLDKEKTDDMSWIPKGVQIICVECSSEVEMFNRWAEWWCHRQNSADITIGWNVANYDFATLAGRMQVLAGIYPASVNWGRIPDEPSEVKTGNMNTRAHGFQKVTTVSMAGRPVIDLQVLFKKDVTLRLKNYKLNTVASHFLGAQKDPVHHTEMYDLFYGTREERERFLVYNVKDCWLCDALHPRVLYKNFKVASVNRVLLSSLCTRGQQLRVMGGMHKFAVDNDFVIHRPHYHPVLDEFLREDAVKEEDDEGDDDEGRSKTALKYDFEMEKIVEQWENMYADNAKSISIKEVTVDANGKESVKVVNMSTGTRKRTAEEIRAEKENEAKRLMGLLDDKKKSARAKMSRSKQLHRNEQLSGSAKNILAAIQRRVDIDRIVEEEQRKQDSGTGAEREGPRKKKFQGGKVEHPVPGFYTYVPVGDFNSLYPNIQRTEFIDPALLCIYAEYAQCPDVQYLDVEIKPGVSFRFAKFRKGIMTQSITNLINNRKVAQGIQENYQRRCTTMATILQDMIGPLPPKIDKGREEPYKWSDLMAIVDNAFVDADPNEPADPADLAGLYALMWAKEHQVLCDTLAEGITRSKLPAGWYVPPPNVSGWEADILTASEFVKLEKADFIKKGVLRNSLELLEQLAAERDRCSNEADGCINLEISKHCWPLIARLKQVYANYYALESTYNAEQNELKVVANSNFGFCGAGDIEFGDDGRLRRTGMMTVAPVSACVTCIGRMSILKARSIVENYRPGNRVIYIDTDSVFMDVGATSVDEAFDIGEKIIALINKAFSKPEYAQYGYQSYMCMALEKIAGSALLVQAKMYALKKYESRTDSGKHMVKGFSFIKRDCAKFVSSLGMGAIARLLDDGNVQAAVNYVRDALDKFVKKDYMHAEEMANIRKEKARLELAVAEAIARGDDSEKLKSQLKQVAEEETKLKKTIISNLSDLAIYQKISKAVYANPAAHVQLAQIIEQRKPGFGPVAGDSVCYIYIDIGDVENKAPRLQKIEDFEEVIDNPDKYRPDLVWYIDNQIATAMRHVFGAVMEKPLDVLQDARGYAVRMSLGAKDRDILSVIQEQMGFVDDDDVALFERMAGL